MEALFRIPVWQFQSVHLKILYWWGLKRFKKAYPQQDGNRWTDDWTSGASIVVRQVNLSRWKTMAFNFRDQKELGWVVRERSKLISIVRPWSSNARSAKSRERVSITCVPFVTNLYAWRVCERWRLPYRDKKRSLSKSWLKKILTTRTDSKWAALLVVMSSGMRFSWRALWMQSDLFEEVKNSCQTFPSSFLLIS